VRVICQTCATWAPSVCGTSVWVHITRTRRKLVRLHPCAAILPLRAASLSASRLDAGADLWRMWRKRQTRAARRRAGRRTCDLDDAESPQAPRQDVGMPLMTGRREKHVTTAGKCAVLPVPAKVRNTDVDPWLEVSTTEPVYVLTFRALIRKELSVSVHEFVLGPPTPRSTKTSALIKAIPALRILQKRRRIISI
jgi:hypothetical protein